MLPRFHVFFSESFFVVVVPGSQDVEQALTAIAQVSDHASAPLERSAPALTSLQERIRKRAKLGHESRENPGR